MVVVFSVGRRCVGDCFLLGLRLVRSSVPVQMLAVAVVVVGWPFDPLLVGPLAEHEMKYVPMVGVGILHMG